LDDIHLGLRFRQPLISDVKQAVELLRKHGWSTDGDQLERKYRPVAGGRKPTVELLEFVRYLYSRVHREVTLTNGETSSLAKTGVRQKDQKPRGNSPVERKPSRPSRRTEEEVRKGIREALNDQANGVPVTTWKGRIIKAEVASRCPNVSQDYLKEVEEWRFYYEHGYLRSDDEPPEAERPAARQLLEQLLPAHQPHQRRPEQKNKAEKLDFLAELTELLIPVARMPKDDDRLEAGHEALRQFFDEKSEKMYPLITPPGENTQPVHWSEAHTDDEN